MSVTIIAQLGGKVNHTDYTGMMYSFQLRLIFKSAYDIMKETKILY